MVKQLINYDKAKLMTEHKPAFYLQKVNNLPGLDPDVAAYALVDEDGKKVDWIDSVYVLTDTASKEYGVYLGLLTRDSREKLNDELKEGYVGRHIVRFLVSRAACEEYEGHIFISRSM